MQADKEVLCRKRASYILQQSVLDEMTPGTTWHSFFLLYDVLEEFAPYLIQARWLLGLRTFAVKQGSSQQSLLQMTSASQKSLETTSLTSKRYFMYTDNSAFISLCWKAMQGVSQIVNLYVFQNILHKLHRRLNHYSYQVNIESFHRTHGTCTWKDYWMQLFLMGEQASCNKLI